MTAISTGVLHVRADRTAWLGYAEWLDTARGHRGQLAEITADAVLTLTDPDAPCSGLSQPVFEGPVREAPAQVLPGLYLVTFEVEGERQWIARRSQESVYGFLEDASERGLAIRLARALADKPVGAIVRYERGVLTDEQGFL